MNAQVSTIGWFAAHESRLIWRDFLGMMTGGKPKRTAALVIIVSLFVAAMHAYAAYLIHPAIEAGNRAGIVADKATMMLVAGGLFMFVSLMFSQALESVTRAYYTRSDLDLILSSPAKSHQLFQVRTGILVAQTVMLSILIASPLINVLIYYDGWHWVGAYLTIMALGGFVTTLAVWITLGLFHVVGPAKTRLIAQIIAAVVGAGFVIVLQGVAIMLGQGFSRLSLFQSAQSIAAAPAETSVVWLPVKAAMGEPWALSVMFTFCASLLLITIIWSARRFAFDVLNTSGLSEAPKKQSVFTGFRRKTSVPYTLCRKEWMLLKRDPWLVSQSLQQILYLLPPALMLWVNYGESTGILFVVIPVIVMAAGQLAGSLAWLAISGEDAHELIATAPIDERTILKSKILAVLAIIAVVLLPFLLGLLIVDPRAALFMMAGGGLASASAVTVQIMFRSQANRSLFRRRQVSSRAATICEALVSILWAAATGLTVIGTVIAVIPAILVFVVLGVAWLIKI